MATKRPNAAILVYFSMYGSKNLIADQPGDNDLAGLYHTLRHENRLLSVLWQAGFLAK